MSTERSPNSLAQAGSAYLRSAAHQPVRWREWGGAAFEEAQRQDKPILLDIGAVWCHWCHVMDRESYENEEIAKIINEHYVPVKVDRDERPDIDARYQVAVSALTGQGGWPLTAFLTPQGKPFYGGTYFPPEDNFGRPGMRRLLDSIAMNYQAHKNEIFSSAEKISAVLNASEEFPEARGGANRELVESLIANISQTFDPQHGGFGGAPKFPHPAALDLLLDAYLEKREPWLLTVVTTTLEAMGQGGVYDQIGGGFHRYSVDERWIVPHFEKMAYDNAGLLRNYLQAYLITGKDFFREIALGIVSFVEQVLSNPQGGFYASQDADINLEDDGDYFTWTLGELNSVLSELEAEVVAQRFHIEERGEMRHDPAKNVLFIDQPFEAISARLSLSQEEVKTILAEAKAKMVAARGKRPTPFVDTALYTHWNGMMISAFLEAHRVLGLERARSLALSTLDLLLEKAYDPARGMAHTVLRLPSGNGPNAGFRISNFDLLDDQVFISNALLDAFEVTGRRDYFNRALELMETTIRRFWDAGRGGFFDAAKDLAERQGSLQMTRKVLQDSPAPAANSLAVMVLDRLARWADRPDLGEKAQGILDLFGSKAGDYGLFAGSFGLALLDHLRPPAEVVVAGPPDDERTRSLLKAAYQAPCAGKRVLAFEPGAAKSGDLPKGLAATLANLPGEGKPVALVCLGATCKPPVYTPESLAAALT